MGDATAPLLVVLTGPTGSGKSELALQLAARLEPTLPLEIISADSAQVYRGMDIGTAKPSAERRRSVPHHLIDIRDPAQAYSAGDFVRDAHAAIRQIHARGRQPLLVGGTMLYLRALHRGLAALPPASAAVRAELDAQAQLEGWSALHAQLARVDPAAAARIAPADAQRIQRALEVHRLTGVPISEWQRCAPGAAEPFHWLRYALLPADADARIALRARLAARFAHMLQAGLFEEVRRLHARGDLTGQHASIRAVGYRQLWQVFTGGSSLAEAQRQAVIATAQLAKRQLTWLRGEPQLVALPLGAAELAGDASAAAHVGRVEALAAEILGARRA
ncbi:MAG: tRNA (adenosine(37)-N6)-dimethylallyltransferase MiaA [Steroidobacteraceae bacterium]